jgi:hypothetical protein
MVRLAIAGAVAASICGEAYAQQNSPVTLNDLHQELGKLIDENGNKPLEEFSITIAPPDVEPPLIGPIQSSTDEEGRLMVLSSFNPGRCTWDPLRAKYMQDLGFYIIEFCQPASVTTYAWGDFHKLADASGALGSLIGSEKFFCNVPADLLMMTVRARTDFCQGN